MANERRTVDGATAGTVTGRGLAAGTVSSSGPELRSASELGEATTLGGPGGGVVLLGTRETLLSAAAQAAGSALLRPRLVGAVVVETGGVEDRRELLPERHDSDGGMGVVRRSAWAAGLPLLGEVDQLPAVLDRVRPGLVLVCLPTAMRDVVRAVVSTLERLGVAHRFLATIEDVAMRPGTVGSPLMAPTPEVNLHALVGREPRRPNDALIRRVVTGRRVLITGAGGSIGSELARLCARFGPRLLVLMDRAENALFDIDRYLREHHPRVERKAVLHDVVQSEGTLRWLTELRPDAVFHTAAHKHVPLMQDHPAAALTNNLFGTRAVADAALACGAERFVLVSTDKAVRPTSVMGATKQLAERYIRAQNRRERTRFALVRFGNVLGSAASVLPIWASQIAEGGPMTVTDPRMTRYFMTIPEAAALVLQASAIATTSDLNPDLDPADVFVLDMGEPVGIMELARRFARSLGLVALTDDELIAAESNASPLGPTVSVRVTGMRPGEKLHEELAHDRSQLESTSVRGVFCWRGTPPTLADADSMLHELSAVRGCAEPARVVEAIQRYVVGGAGLSCARTAA